jgi:hypothetical protein
MKKSCLCKIVQVVLFLMIAAGVWAQSTTVTATITDTSFQSWNNGTYSITFIPTPGKPGPYYWNGTPYTGQTFSGALDSTGTFTATIPTNSFITPSGTQWNFTVCPNASAPCHTVVLPVSGNSQNLSSTLSVNNPPIAFNPTPFQYGYSDSEVLPLPGVGQQYFNVTSKQPEYWDGAHWLDFPTAGSFIQIAPPGSQTVTQPVNTNLNVITSGSGAFTYNGNTVATVNQITPAGTAVLLGPSGSQTVTQPVNTSLNVNTSGSGVFSTNVSGVAPLWTGTSLITNVTPPITTTATSTSGSATFVVTSATGLQVGMSIVSSFTPGSCNIPAGAFTIPSITAISGTSITMSCPATATNASPVSITFGKVRTDPTAASIENSVASNWLLVGGAAQGNTGLGLGYDDPTNMNAQILGNGKSLGLLVGAQASTGTSGSGIRPLTGAVVMDSFNGSATNYDSWVGYFQSLLMSGTNNTSQHIQFEQSINSNWTPVVQDEDPYIVTQLNNTVVHRLDCGTGQTFGSGTAPNECSTAMDILQNGAPFKVGIVFGLNALDVSSGRIAPALSLPPNNALFWSISEGNHPVQVYGDASGGLHLNSSSGQGAQINHMGNSIGFQTVLTTSTCTPANTAFASCFFSVSLPVVEPDSSYTWNCSIGGVNAFIGPIGSITTTGFTVTVYATGGGTPVVNGASCIITHS